MSRGKEWARRLYNDPVLGFPPYARLRLIYEALDIPQNDFAELCGSSRAQNATWKNILAGFVTGNPKVMGAGGNSRIREEYFTALHESMRRQNRPLPANTFTEPMDRAGFEALVRAWAPDAQAPAVPLDPRNRIPELAEVVLQWSTAGELSRHRLAAWWSGPRGKGGDHIGFVGPPMTGKTVLVSSWSREAQVKTCWFDCRQFLSHEITVDIVLRELLAFGKDTPRTLNYDKASVGARVAQIFEALARLDDVLLVFDGFDTLMDNAGAIDERPRDVMIFELLRGIMQSGRVRTISCSRFAVTLLDVRWHDLDLTWVPRHQAERRRPRDKLVRVVSRRKAPKSPDAFGAELIVDNLLAALSPAQRSLFAFIVLIGEEVRDVTLRWFCLTELQLGPDQVEAFLEDFWATCRGSDAIPFKFHADPEFDHPPEVDLVDGALHYRFHDAVTSIAAERFDSGGASAPVERIHLRIAERARLTMSVDDCHERNVLGRFARPAQVVKHMVASISAADLQRAWENHAREGFLILARDGPPAPLRDDEAMKRWEAERAIFDPQSSIADRFFYAYDILYRGLIDPRHSHPLSTVNGADRAKLDLLARFFERAESPFRRRDVDPYGLPLLPVDLLTELLAALAMAGLNSGALPEARWAADRAHQLLIAWGERVNASATRDKTLVGLARIRVDIMTQSGHLAEAEAACLEALDPASEFCRVAPKSDLQKLQLRYARIIYLLRRIPAALDYLRTIGLEVETEEDDLNFHDIDLSGRSGRIWAMILLRSLRTRRPKSDVRTFKQITALVELNRARALDKPNERVAVAVIEAIVERIDAEALALWSAHSIIDPKGLERSRKRLDIAQRLAWNRGVNTATRLDLVLEIARTEMLLGNHERAREHIERLIETAKAYGYRIIESDAQMLAGEVSWMQACELDSAEKPQAAEPFHEQASAHLARTVEIERETGYCGHHTRIHMMRRGASPTLAGEL